MTVKLLADRFPTRFSIRLSHHLPFSRRRGLSRKKLAHPAAILASRLQPRATPNPLLASPGDLFMLANAWGLVELTGIEPVASWLQTRRSPS
jgi:hypothetical protein